MTQIEITVTHGGSHTEKQTAQVRMSGANDLELMIDAMRATAICMGFTPETVARLSLLPRPIEEVLV
jgi:hypothetical protein